MVKKPQRKRLPRKKFDTDIELCRKNGQNTFTFNVGTLFTVNAENGVRDTGLCLVPFRAIDTRTL
jgi:hypothetical protein